MTRGQLLFVVLNAVFVTFLLMAELTGAKLFQIQTGSWPVLPALGISALTLTMGVVPFPVTFLITDLLNEYYGRRLVRFTTLLGTVCIILAFGVIYIGREIPAASFSSVGDAEFNTVFLNSEVIIIASVIAYMIGQMVDIQVFHRLRIWTQGRHIWLRATGSTFVSQILDSYIVIYLAFHYLATEENRKSLDLCFEIATTNLIYKLGIAIGMTPLIYLGHWALDRFLGREGTLMRERAHAGTKS
jgi:uncharacterized integral membrane protein (TIGR00697 family)